MLKELNAVQQHHRSNKNTPIDKIFIEKKPHTCGDCNLIISLQKNRTFKCARILHNVSNASFYLPENVQNIVSLDSSLLAIHLKMLLRVILETKTTVIYTEKKKKAQ